VSLCCLLWLFHFTRRQSRTSTATMFLNATIHSLLSLSPTTLLQPERLAGCYCSVTRDIERAYIMTERRSVPCDGRGGHRQTLDVNVNTPVLMYLTADSSYSQTSLITHSYYQSISNPHNHHYSSSSTETSCYHKPLQASPRPPSADFLHQPSCLRKSNGTLDRRYRTSRIIQAADTTSPTDGGRLHRC
jgi:hypothetical protein